MSECLKHWLLTDNYTVDEAALLLAGIEPYEVGRDVKLALKEKKPRAGKAAIYRMVLNKETADGGTIPRIHFTERPDPATAESFTITQYWRYWFLSRESILDFASRRGLDFPYGCPIDSCNSNYKDQNQSLVIEPSENSKNTYLSIIGALVTVLAEFDESNERPLKNRKMVRSDGISAKAVADIISERFEGTELPLKRSNTIVKEALRLIEKAEIPCAVTIQHPAKAYCCNFEPL
ncbi:hypothetical protein [Endozoicomonas sp.]|uniref:hypothetical protein n=1 Tax=Endozoicomonas sp. TaxID=1892382 RepID=UPI003AF52EAD